MPHPRTSFTLALLAVLAAGAPLPFLTQGKTSPSQEETESASLAPCFMELNFSGIPRNIRILYQGKELASLPKDTPSPWLETLSLPKTDVLELEVEAHWEQAGTPQAISLQLEPYKLPSRSETRWSTEDGSHLHDLFLFQW